MGKETKAKWTSIWGNINKSIAKGGNGRGRSSRNGFKYNSLPMGEDDDFAGEDTSLIHRQYSNRHDIEMSTEMIDLNGKTNKKEN